MAGVTPGVGGMCRKKESQSNEETRVLVEMV
jgi:hypothetical protein